CPPACCEAVVPPPRIFVRTRPPPALLDHSLSQQPLDNPIQRTRREPYFPARSSLDVFQNRVPVLFVIYQGQQDVKQGGGKWLGGRIYVAHNYIASHYIVTRSICQLDRAWMVTAM